MPPRTRAVRAPKASKENVDILTKTTAKNTGKDSKPARKPLADKTNSASDENGSPAPVKKAIKKTDKRSQKVVPVVSDDERPRRNRRLPPRYIENHVLNNLSNGKQNATTPNKSLNKTPVKDASEINKSQNKTPVKDASEINKSQNKTPVKDASKIESPFKTPSNVLDNSLIANRPKRVSRLPSKFDENSVSPNKFVPISCHTSTPLVPKPQDSNKILGVKQKLATQSETSEKDNSLLTTKVTPQKGSLRKTTLRKVTPQKLSPVKTTPNKITPKKSALTKTTPKQSTPSKVSPNKATPNKVVPKKVPALKITPKKTEVAQKKLVQKKLSKVVKNNLDTNLNTRQERVRRLRKPVEYKEDTLSPKLLSPKNSKHVEGRKILKVNSSFRVLEDKNSKKGDGQDIYEFTFDPTEEPAPQKKKRKKVLAKKPAKPKTRVYNNNYEKNIARALADLKNVVTKQKPDKTAEVTVPANNKVVQPSSKKVPTSEPGPSSVVITVAEVHTEPAKNNSARSNHSNKNHVSIRVEDIAADFDASLDHDINYSPVNSPNRMEPEPENYLTAMSPEREILRPDDPLNLRNELSFFDDQPVANSSMNASSRNPMSTPWRAEFENLPIKWQANTYVKPDMTPALECSFINNFDDSKKKHVYTNMVTQSHDVLPEIEENEAPKLKQTSIISFIKEVVERNSIKKKRGQQTPTKASSLFDVSNGSKTPRKDTAEASSKDSSLENKVTEGNKTQKRKNNLDNNPTPAKKPRKDNENTLFGFDDSENQDQENLSPVKIVNNNRLRSLRSRSGAVLKELNKQTGPMRAELPAAMKAKLAPSSDVVEKIYDQMKSATDAPVLLAKQGDTVGATDVAEMPENLEDDDSQSVHLFEDIELVHHLKPTRKSYGKAKKVTFQNSTANVFEDEAPVRNQSSDDDDDLGDLSFHLPEVKAKKATKKKKTKKQVLSKKEKAEVDAWAACFNSMCEDIEEFDLVVE